MVYLLKMVIDDCVYEIYKIPAFPFHASSSFSPSGWESAGIARARTRTRMARMARMARS